MLLSGLNNENEFYSDHYLAEIFEGDIREVLAAWQERENSRREQAKTKGQSSAQYSGYRTPANQLNGLGRDYLARLDEAERQRNPKGRVTALRAQTARLLSVFELATGPGAHTLDDGTLLPTLAEHKDASGHPLLWILEAMLPAGENRDQDPLSPLRDQVIQKGISQAKVPSWQVESAALVWADIQSLPEGAVTKTQLDDTLPSIPAERTVEHHLPFFSPDENETTALLDDLIQALALQSVNIFTKI